MKFTRLLAPFSIVLNRAIFLDRDGTLIREAGYPQRRENLHIYPRAFEAARQINESGILAIVITNQSAVARGLLTEKQLQRLHRDLRDMFQKKGARLDAFYYCPHHPEGDGDYKQACQCRKPEPGLLFQAAQDFQIDLGASHLIGDRLLDVEAAHRAGCGSVLVKSGYGRTELKSLGKASSGIRCVRPHHIAEDVLDGVNWILGRSARKTQAP